MNLNGSLMNDRPDLNESGSQSIDRSLNADIRYFSQIGLRLLAFVFVIFFTLCFVVFYNGSLETKRQLERQVSQAVNTLSVPMANFNYQSARAIAIQLESLEGIGGVHVVDDFNVTIYDSLADGDRRERHEIPIPQALHSEKSIGTLSIVYETLGLLTIILRSSFYATILALLFLAPTVLYFNYHLNLYIRAPLLALNEAIMQTSRTGQNALVGYDQENSFGLLATRFNQMQKLILDRTKESENALKHVSQILEELQENKNAMAHTLSAIKQTVIMFDQKGKPLAMNISEPFLEEDGEKFQKCMKLTHPLEGLKKYFPCTRLVLSDEGDSDTTIFTMRMKPGQYLRGILVSSTQFRALILIDQTEIETAEAIMEEVLTETDVGLVFVRDSGEIISYKGAHFERLFSGARNEENVLPIQRLPLKYTQLAKEQRSIDVMNDVYHLRAVSLPADITCVVHFDITSARDMEKRLQESESLSNIGQMASGLAHDFNNILGVIVSCLEVVEQRYEVSEFIEPAITAAGRGADVVKEILSYARSTKVEPEMVFLDDFLNYNQEVFARASSEGVNVIVKSDTNAWISIDRSMFISMMLNLTVNANNAMSGQGVIKIETSVLVENSPTEKGEVVITFSDNGPGVPSELREKIFEPFFTSRTEHGGTGLGLAMVANFIRTSGGDIKLINSDHGACFEIHLPIQSIRSAELDPSFINSQKVVPDAVAKSKFDLKVVLVDDETVLVHMLRKVLELSGCHVETFHSAHECLDAWGKLVDFDLLITDNNMPGQSGIELLSELRSRGVNIPTLVMSGNVSPEMEKEGVELGVAEFLWKPLPRTKLIAALARINDQIVQTKKIAN